MKENKDIDREKLDAEELEIRVKTKEASPFGKKLSNFWYYHKWKVIIISFFVITFTVCSFQMCTKEDPDDMILIAGPAYFDNKDMIAVRDVLTSLKPSNNDGSAKKLDIYTYSIYSEDELYEANHSVKNENGQYVTMVNRPYNVEQNSQYFQFLSTGECSILIVSEYLYSNLVENDRVLPLSQLFGEDLPEGALDDGLGVRLGDTDLYASSNALRVLDGDMVICLLRSYVMGASSNKERYEESKELFIRIVTYETEGKTEESECSEKPSEILTESTTESNTESNTEANTETN